MPSIVPNLETTTSLGADTLARKWVIDVDMTYQPGVVGTPVWTRLRGISDQSPKEDPTTQDSSDYDSKGWKSEAVTAMGWGWELTVGRKVDAASGIYYDPAQEYLRLKSLQMGPGNVASIRVYEWNGIEGPRVMAYSGLVGVAWSGQGGGMDELDTAKITLTGQGQRYDIVHPAAPTTWATGTAYVKGDRIKLATGHVLQCVVPGTSGTTAPTSTTLTDGPVTWKVISTT